MTVAEWLEGRVPAPPAQLAARLRTAMGPYMLADASEAPDRLLDAAESLLARSLAEGLRSRESALDLLTVDALVTYAFEASAGQTGSLPERGIRAMRSIASLAGTAP